MTKGERIKQKRESKNLSQTELARQMGITKQTIFKYENDIVSNIPSDKIELLCKCLETTPSFIMGWSTEQETTTKKNYEILLSTFKQLNLRGQAKVLDYVNDLNQITLYQNNHDINKE